MDAPTRRVPEQGPSGRAAGRAVVPERATTDARTHAPRRVAPRARGSTIRHVIQDVDQLLEKLVKKEALNGSSVELVFEAPTKDWVARRSGPCVNLYLYDIREDLQRRVPDLGGQPRPGRDGQRAPAATPPVPARVPRDGLDPAPRGRAPPAVVAARSACCATRCSSRASSAAASTRPTCPCTSRSASPRRQERSLADIWTALGGELKPSLDVVVIAPVVGGHQLPVRAAGHLRTDDRAREHQRRDRGGRRHRQAGRARTGAERSRCPRRPSRSGAEQGPGRPAAAGARQASVSAVVEASAGDAGATGHRGGRAPGSRRRHGLGYLARAAGAARGARPRAPSTGGGAPTRTRRTGSAGLYISDDQVDALLAGSPGQHRARRGRRAAAGASLERPRGPRGGRAEAAGRAIRLRDLARRVRARSRGRRAVPGRARPGPRPALRAAVRLPPRRRLASARERRPRAGAGRWRAAGRRTRPRARGSARWRRSSARACCSSRTRTGRCSPGPSACRTGSSPTSSPTTRRTRSWSRCSRRPSRSTSPRWSRWSAAMAGGPRPRLPARAAGRLRAVAGLDRAGAARAAVRRARPRPARRRRRPGGDRRSRPRARRGSGAPGWSSGRSRRSWSAARRPSVPSPSCRARCCSSARGPGTRPGRASRRSCSRRRCPRSPCATTSGRGRSTAMRPRASTRPRPRSRSGWRPSRSTGRPARRARRRRRPAGRWSSTTSRAGARAQNAAGLERLSRRIVPSVGWDGPRPAAGRRAAAARAHRTRPPPRPRRRRVVDGDQGLARPRHHGACSPATPGPARRSRPRCSRATSASTST